MSTSKTTKTNKYIGKELDWLEEQWQSLKQYVDDNPIGEMRDRVIQLSTGKNDIDKVTATIEQQIKSVRDTLKELPDLFAAISNLREKNEQKDIAVRGQGTIPHMMRT